MESLSDVIMFEWLLIVFGIILLFLTMYDICWTILSAAEAGPISRLIMNFYKVMAHLFRRVPRSHNIVRSIGLFTFLTSIIVWYMMFWMGWALIFISVSSSVVSSSSNSSANTVQKIYYVGYMIFTAGLGDFKPMGGTFQMLSVLANATGIILVTITIAYLLSATDAVTRQRQVAGHISALGDDPQDILINAWDNHDFSSLDRPLSSISNEITISAQHLIRFPLIFNFHSIEKDYSASIKLAAIDEAVTIMECVMLPSCRIKKLTMVQCRRALDQYMNALEVAVNVNFEKEIPDVPLPDLRLLHSRGIPLLPHRQWRENFSRKHIVSRRKMLYKMVVDSTRKWGEVYGDGEFT